MKQSIRNKIYRNRWRLNYTLGQIFEASRGIIFWICPGNGFKYYLSHYNGKVTKMKDQYPDNRPLKTVKCSRCPL